MILGSVTLNVVARQAFTGQSEIDCGKTGSEPQRRHAGTRSSQGY